MRCLKRVLTWAMVLVYLLGFAGTASAGTLIIPGGVVAIEQDSFANTAATSIVIPATTESIASGAFAQSDLLTDVYLPANTVAIAEDAFDSDSSLVFHAYMGSENANWALDHGYQVEYIMGDIGAPSSNAWERVNTLIATEPVSSKNDDPYYTYRLVTKLTGGSELPDLESFNPKATVRILIPCMYCNSTMTPTQNGARTR